MFDVDKAARNLKRGGFRELPRDEDGNRRFKAVSSTVYVLTPEGLERH